MAQFPCPRCGGKMFIEKVHEGYEVPCPHCGESFRVPRGAAGQADRPAQSPTGFAASSRSDSVAEAAPVRSEPADAAPVEEAAVDEAPAPPDMEVEPDGSEDLQAPQRRATAATRGATPPPPPPRLRSSVPTPRQKGTSGQDTTAFVLGILSLVACAALGPFAWHFGHQARLAARRRNMEPDGLATAGWVMGIIGTVLLVASLGFLALMFAVGAANGF